LITYNEEGVLNGGSVSHGAEEVVAEDHSLHLLEEAIAHLELLHGTGDVTVAVKDTHLGETSDVNLMSHVALQVNGDSRLGVGNDAHGLEVVERLVTDFINHFY